jgi:hypothetical protein
LVDKLVGNSRLVHGGMSKNGNEVTGSGSDTKGNL